MNPSINVGMKLYNALIKKDQNNKIEDIILLEEGFSWVALFFSLPWFLFHKMWRHALILLVINSLFVHFGNSEFFSKTDLLLLEISLSLMIALNAGYWYNQHLQQKGYIPLNYNLAHNKEEARIKAMEDFYFRNPNLNFNEFSDAIIDPAAYNKLAKTKKKQPYFTA